MPGYPGLPGQPGLPGIQGETGLHGMRGGTNIFFFTSNISIFILNSLRVSWAKGRNEEAWLRRILEENWEEANIFQETCEETYKAFQHRNTILISQHVQKAESETAQKNPKKQTKEWQGVQPEKPPALQTPPTLASEKKKDKTGKLLKAETTHHHTDRVLERTCGQKRVKNEADVTFNSFDHRIVEI